MTNERFDASLDGVGIAEDVKAVDAKHVEAVTSDERVPVRVGLRGFCGRVRLPVNLDIELRVQTGEVQRVRRQGNLPSELQTPHPLLPQHLPNVPVVIRFGRALLPGERDAFGVTLGAPIATRFADGHGGAPVLVGGDAESTKLNAVPPSLAPPSPVRAAGSGLCNRSFDRPRIIDAARTGAGGSGGRGPTAGRMKRRFARCRSWPARELSLSPFPHPATSPRPPGPPAPVDRGGRTKFNRCSRTLIASRPGPNPQGRGERVRVTLSGEQKRVESEVCR